jgi:hypothetical protein
MMFNSHLSSDDFLCPWAQCFLALDPKIDHSHSFRPPVEIVARVFKKILPSKSLSDLIKSKKDWPASFNLPKGTWWDSP